jgi:GxxExxY protein
MRPNEVSYKVIGAAMKVHSALGAGLLESAYEKALCHEFTRIGLQFKRQVRVPIDYHGVKLPNAFIVDFVVESCVLVEIKSVEKVLPVHRSQLLSYLKLTNCPSVCCSTSKVPHVREGICRLINAPQDQL